MSRRDTIIIAVLVNLGLLAVLFMTAIQFDGDGTNDPIESTPIAEVEHNRSLDNAEYIAIQNAGDELDNAIKDYAKKANLEPIVLEEEVIAMAETKSSSEKKQIDPNAEYVEVSVKRGDILEKIAKANGTTIAAIKQANNLKSEKLAIGQVLKIPVAVTVKKKDVKDNKVAVTEGLKPLEVVPGDPVYYTIKSGDNPWKIAKQCKVKVDDLLKLNKLDEGKARNLKVGDKIRVK